MESPKHNSYLDLPALTLLDEYGKGRHIPGSGSAAALSGLIAVGLLKTVCKLTLRKPKYKDVHNQLGYILEQLETNYHPKLIELFNEDIKVFGVVSDLRKQRDNATEPKEKEKIGREALDKQRIATVIPIEICKICIEMTTHAFAIFDAGFKSARGDSGVAISNLISAISGSLFVVFLNLKSYKDSKWLQTTQAEAERLVIEYDKIQKLAFGRVLNLYSEGISEDSMQLKIVFKDQFPSND